MRGEVRACGRRLQGFSLVELLVAAVVSIFVLGAVVVLMSQGFNVVGANTAYSVAQRSALSSVEFLPKEIAYASQVEIISDPAHVITDTLLSEDWHYILRTSDKVRHLYWDKGRKEEMVPGSEFVTKLKFDADIFSSDQYGGGRVLLFHVEAEKDRKNVALDRSRLVHAIEGVMGEDNVSIDAAFPGGPILRYRAMPLDNSVEVNLFGSLNTNDTTASFDYGKPDTWGRIEHYSTVTKIDATLSLSKDAQDRMDPTEPPVFTWIVAQTDTFFSKYPELSGDLFEKLKKTEKQGKLLRVLKADNYLQNRIDDRAAGRKVSPNQLKNASFEQGYRILEVSSGKQMKTNTYSTEFCLDLGGIVNTLLRQPGDYQGARMIVVAHYKDKDGTWNMAPAFSGLSEDSSSGGLWERVMDVATGTGAFAGGMLNQHKDFGSIVSVFDKNAGRWNFTAYGGYNARRRGPQMLLTLTAEDFKHLKPKDPSKLDLYGVTNYTLYLEGQLTYTAKAKTLDGGYSVLLNGSAPQTVQLGSIKEHLSSGYMFQLDPGAGGYLMRYAYYKTPNLNQVSIINTANGDNYLNVYDHDVGVAFGVHPLYAYDASKARHGKPRTMEAPQIVNFFAAQSSADLTVLSEDFNRHVGVLNPEQRIFYRLPFMPQGGKDAGGTDPYYTRESVMRTFTRGRDKIGLSHYLAYGGPYGMTYGGSSRSVYSPKHMQTWQLYYKESDTKGTHDPETKITMDFPSKSDTRQGYRWDLREIKDGGTKEVPIVWRTRHLVKLTVLEITRDILA
ncbi:MAG: hypothetical protein LBJ22_06010 [Synergistaceae bacterium]|jgi:type II secretory pathway pseudopilin PulG|nr:hypothetical protein [Synergistaceae bacterium]